MFVRKLDECPALITFPVNENRGIRYASMQHPVKRQLRFVLLLPVVLALTQVHAQELTKRPSDYQLIPRDIASNLGFITYEGSSSDQKIDAVVLEVYTDGLLEHEQRTTLSYANGAADFSVSIPVPSGRVSYRSAFYAEVAGEQTLIHEADSIVVGDVYLVNGQSNAEASSFSGSASSFESPWIRSFGLPAYTDPTAVSDDLNWYPATGDEAESPGFIGQWSLVLSRYIVDTHDVPVAVLNGGQKGTAEHVMSIADFRRNVFDDESLNTNYGRLLYRTRKAGVDRHVRGYFWYQGESDGSSEANTAPEAYQRRFDLLYSQWKDDYPAIESIFLVQVRAGCGDPPPPLRNAQRRLADMYPDIPLMSTTAIGGHDGCHFGFDPGYRQLGNHLSKLVGHLLYGEPDSPGIHPPNVSQAYYAGEDRTEIVVELRDADALLSIDDGAEASIAITEGSAAIVGAVPEKGRIILELDQPGDPAGVLQYAEPRCAEPRCPWNVWIRNARGVGMLAFSDIRIRPERLQAPGIQTIASTTEGVVLSWQPLSDTLLGGYVILKGPDAGSLRAIDTVSVSSEAYVDEDVSLGETLVYALAVLDENGVQSPISEPEQIQITVEVASERDRRIPERTSLRLSVSPHPCSIRCKIALTGPNPEQATLSVVDVTGRTVATVDLTGESPLHQGAVWDPGPLPSGVYFLFARTPTSVIARPLVLTGR